jgi:hypothetical protein
MGDGGLRGLDRPLGSSDPVSAEDVSKVRQAIGDSFPDFRIECA